MAAYPFQLKKNGSSLTEKIVDLFRKSKYVNLAVTPEGTRSRKEKWRTGFLYISYEAQVPIQLGIIDYAKKEIRINEEFYPSSDIEKDMKYVKKFYTNSANAARYPEKFTI